MATAVSTPKRHTKSQSTYAFDNTATNVAASQMRNALNNLADTVKDPEVKRKFENEMDNFFSLFRRYLTEKASGTTLDWEKIRSPSADEVVAYTKLDDDKSNASANLSKLAVLKLNGGLGTSMGCVGPKSVIEVRDGNTFLDLSVRQIEHLNRTFDADVPLLLMNSFNTDADTAKIIKKYQGHRIRVKTFNQSRFPRIYKDSLLPVPESYDDSLDSCLLYTSPSPRD